MQTSVVLLLIVAVIVMLRVSSEAGPKAVDVQTLDIYHGSPRPGWACWPTAWQDEAGAVYVAFQELRRAPNPAWEPVPLDFWESIGLPTSYQITLCGGTKDLVPESVVMKSTDGCKTWKEIGRDAERVTTSFAWHTLPDGKIIRAVSTDYLAWGRNSTPRTYSEISTDGGKTWSRKTTIIEGFSTDCGPYRLKVLKDGTLAALGSYSDAWQPGQRRFGRNQKRPYVRQEITAAFWFSKDNGKSWSGAFNVLPGVTAYEADFLELPSGDLLIINSATAGASQVRQYVRKSRWGWVSGPVMDVIAGKVPERLAYGRDGMIVGAVRGGSYTCSNDEGATWHQVSSVPNAEYQPFTIPLKDGRYFTVWHAGGGDEPFGEKDLWIGAHMFRLENDLPQPTSLTLERQLDDSKQRMGNSYLASLVSGGKPLVGKTLHYKFIKRYGGGGEGSITTDAKGQALIDLTKEFQAETNIHASYNLTVTFDPAAGDELAPSTSGEYFAYAITATKKELGW